MAFLLDERGPLFESRPMMLKDFLRDDDSHTCTSSSCKSKIAVSSNTLNKPHIVLLRSWSTRKISAVHKLLHFTYLKSPSVLTRSISRKSSKRSKDKNDISGEVKVKVKDILRWRSFRDVMEDQSMPLDFPSSPYRSTSTSTDTTRRSIEEVPPCGGGENEEFWGKKCFFGQTPGTNAAALRNPKVMDWSFEECEQQSPVSVLDSPFREVEEIISPIHPILTNVQRAKCTIPRAIHHKLNLERVDAAEEKAKELLSHLKEDNKSQAYDNVILDLFMHELSINGKLHDHEFDCKILRIAKSWIDGEYDDEWYDWEVEDKRESYVKDMEKGICWNKFEEDQDVSKELEVMVLNDLIDDLLFDFYC